MPRLRSRNFDRLPRHALSEVPSTTYANVHCLGLTFDSVSDPHQEEWETEIRDLGATLVEDYYYTFEHKRLCGVDKAICGVEIASHTSSFAKRYGDADNLAIVFYGGHGSTGGPLRDQWYAMSSGKSRAASAPPGGQVPVWGIRVELFLKSLLKDARCDIVFIVDACHGGTARKAFGNLRKQYRPHFAGRNIHLFAATNGPTPGPVPMNRGTTPSTGLWTFTKMFRLELMTGIDRGMFGNVDNLKGRVCMLYDSQQLGNDVSSATLADRCEGAAASLRPNYNRLYRDIYNSIVCSFIQSDLWETGRKWVFVLVFRNDRTSLDDFTRPWRCDEGIYKMDTHQRLDDLPRLAVGFQYALCGTHFSSSTSIGSLHAVITNRLGVDCANEGLLLLHMVPNQVIGLGTECDSYTPCRCGQVHGPRVEDLRSGSMSVS